MKQTLFHQKKYIFWDLDGTLTDSALGITRSVAHALAHFGIKEKNQAALRAFVGPPLIDCFMELYGFSPEQAWEAVEVYREYFGQTGLFENEVYPGVPDLLGELMRNRRRMIVTTSKPEQYAKQILAHFGLDRYFVDICGSEMDESRTKKQEVLQYALGKNKVSNLGDCVLIGDRKYDVQGAKAVGMQCIGVLYGYGDRRELEKAGADALAPDLADLRTLLLSQ